MITLDANNKTIFITKPLKVSELESYLSSFKIVYKDLASWEIKMIQGEGELSGEVTTPVMPEITPL